MSVRTLSTQHGRDDLLRVAVGSIVLFLTIQLGRIIYKAFFGPLSGFPGSRRHALTRLAFNYDKFMGQEVLIKDEMHKTYGPVVRVGPNDLSFSTAQAWKDIYGHRIGGKASVGKDPDFYGDPITGTHSIVDCNDEDHARMRRILAHSFSEKALRDQEPVLQRWVSLLVEKLREHAQKHQDDSTDMVKRWNCATFDVMGDLTFSESLGMLEGGEYSPWVKTIFESVKLGTQIRILTQVPVLGKLVKPILKKSPGAVKARHEHVRFSVERVQRRLKKTPEQPDIWTEVLRRGEKNDLTVPEMESNANLFMLAGTETTATLLSGLTFYLLKNPESMTKLVREIRDTFSDTDEITLESLFKMPYLNACLEEGLRIYPPVPIGLPRIVPPAGMTIDGIFVPGGTSVSVSQWSSYRAERNFALPDEFHPERWLDGGDERFAGDVKGAFMPFSTGPRNCIGKNLAYHEARLLLAKVLFEFDLELDEKSADWHGQQLVYSLWEKVPLWVKVKQRKI